MIAEQLKDIFREFTPRSLARLPDIYRDDVVFVDPVHRVEGLVALHRYFASVADNLISCEFVYDAQTLAADSACISWNMYFRHQALKRGAPLALRGLSRIRFDDRIYHHEDFYDLGAMVYEHVPLMGGITRFLKRRLAS